MDFQSVFSIHLTLILQGQLYRKLKKGRASPLKRDERRNMLSRILQVNEEDEGKEQGMPQISCSQRKRDDGEKNTGRLSCRSLKSFKKMWQKKREGRERQVYFTKWDSSRDGEDKKKRRPTFDSRGWEKKEREDFWTRNHEEPSSAFTLNASKKRMNLTLENGLHRPSILASLTLTLDFLLMTFSRKRKESHTPLTFKWTTHTLLLGQNRNTWLSKWSLPKHQVVSLREAEELFK